MILLKVSTAATLRCGPFVDKDDAVTPETSVTLGGADQAEALKASGATVDISGATFAAITGADGWYDLSLTSSHTDTVGMLTIVIQDASVCLPVFARAMVLPAQVFDSLVGGTDNLDVNVEDWGNTAVPTTETGGQGVIRRNTAQGGDVQAITLDASASTVANFYRGCAVEIIGGTGVGQKRYVTAYDESSKVATVDDPWITQPDNTSVFRLLAESQGTTAAALVDLMLDEAMVEPSAVPAVTAKVREVLAWLLVLSRNKITQTATTGTLRNDADNATIATTTVSDNGTTGVRGEWT